MTLKEQLAECLSEMESCTAKMRELTAQIEMPELKSVYIDNPGFNIGDTCEVIGNGLPTHLFKVGDVVEVLSVTAISCLCKSGYNMQQFVNFKDLKKL